MNRFTRKFQPLRLLSDEQIEEMHNGCLRILNSTGVIFQSERALKLFENAGCKVKHDEMRVMFPNDLVEDCLSSCPSTFTIKARNSDNDLHLGNNALYFYNSVGNLSVNIDTWEPFKPSLSEQHQGVRVLDALDNLQLLNSYTPYMEIKDVPSCMMLSESFASRLRNSSKISLSGYSNESEIFSIEMAKALDIKPPGWVMAGPPLCYYKDACDAAFRFTEAGFPIFITSGTSYGANGPATIAGSTITHNAELIAGVVFIQIINPETNVLVTDFTFPLDMKDGTPLFGNIGSSLHTAIFAQMWHRYRVPTMVSSSGYSSAKTSDFQCAYEKSISALIAALSGIDIVSLHGGIFAELTYHPIQSILDDDIASMIGRFVESVEVSEETMALGLIEKIGPAPGQYLDTEHTFKWWDRERNTPKSTVNEQIGEWLQNGKKGAIDHAKERLEEILDSHRPIPLTNEQEMEIDKILEEARNYYKLKGML